MIIDKKIKKLETPDLSVDRICRCQDRQFSFLFDSYQPGMVQLSPSYEPIQRLDIKEITGCRQIDSAFFTEDSLVIADSLEKKLFRLHYEFDPTDKLVIKKVDTSPLAPGSIITAAAVMTDYLIFLDKGLSMLRLYDRNFQEIKTVGSRMGYVLSYENRIKPRLGFEFPEDMAAKPDCVVVSDSGNKRLVVINPENWQMEKIIDLPEFPFKILNWKDHRIIVSDFDRSIMTVSLKYGFIHKQELDFAVDFLPTSFQSSSSTTLTGSESGELVELSFPDIPLETLAQEAENWQVLMKIKLDQEKISEAREIASNHKELILEYAKAATDPSWLTPLSSHISETLSKTLERNESLKEEITRLSLEFIKKYKAIPSAEDKEAAHIEKENFRHAMFLHIKEYRESLQSILDMKAATKNYPQAAELIENLLNERFSMVKESLTASINAIKNNLSAFEELKMLTAIVHYWLYCEEMEMLFREQDFYYEKLFGDKFLLALLNDFYFHLAQLFLSHNKIDQYISFTDRELTMYPDKTAIAKPFIETLISLKKYDDARRMLGKFPDQNKENVNYLYYLLYREKGDIDKAFQHIKKELDMYPNRIQLIPHLIGLNKLKPGEVDSYINKILEKAGQTIDVYFNVASAFLTIGDIKQARLYIEKELELFPENQNAIAFKLNLLLNQPEIEEMRQLVARLTAPIYALIRSKVYYRLEEFEKSWNHFKDYLVTNANNSSSLTNAFLIGSLNHLTLDTQEIDWLKEIANRIRFEVYKKEFLVYISYLKYIEKKDINQEIEVFSDEDYLSAYSTNSRAYNHFSKRLAQLKKEKKWDEIFQLAEKILKYNPGDTKIFGILENLNGEN